MTDLFGNTTEEIRALTWKEPYASLMLHGKIETRVWHTDYRGKVLICAGKTPYTEAQLIGLAGEVQAQRILTMRLKEKPGYAIAIAELVSCRRMTKADETPCYVAFNPALWCHVYANVKPIKPFPFKGQQGWKKLDDATKAKIEIL